METYIDIELYFHDVESINGKAIWEDPLPNGKSIKLDELSHQRAKGRWWLSLKTPFLPVQNLHLNMDHGIFNVALITLHAQTIPGFPRSLRVSLRLMKFDPSVYTYQTDMMDELIIWPIFRWYYQQALQKSFYGEVNTNPGKTYLAPIEEQDYASDFAFYYIPSSQVEKTTRTNGRNWMPRYRR